MKCLAALLILTTPAIADDEKKSPLEGSWLVKSGKEDGKDTQKPVGDSVVFAKGSITIKHKAGREQKMTCTVDTSKTPNQIDITHGGMTVKGIFEVKKDTLKLCLAKPGTDRPAKLEAQAGTEQFSIVAAKQKKTK